MNNISLEEFKKLPEYQQFIAENPSKGILKVQVFTADQAIPLADTEIYITKEIGDYNVLFFQGITDSSGIIDNIELPAPGGEYNAETFEIPKFTTYNLIASNEMYKTIKQYQLSMFGDIRVLQYVKMVPNVGEQNGS